MFVEHMLLAAVFAFVFALLVEAAKVLWHRWWNR